MNISFAPDEPQQISILTQSSTNCCDTEVLHYNKTVSNNSLMNGIKSKADLKSIYIYIYIYIYIIRSAFM